MRSKTCCGTAGWWMGRACPTPSGWARVALHARAWSNLRRRCSNGTLLAALSTSIARAQGRSGGCRYETTPQVRAKACSADDGTSARNGLIDAAEISQPLSGKHLVFDGRLLHLVAPELAAEPPHSGSSHRQSERLTPPPRVTFLVNIWLHHKPRSLRPLPAELVPLLRPAQPATRCLQLQRRGAEHTQDSGSEETHSLCEPTLTLPLTASSSMERGMKEAGSALSLDHADAESDDHAQQVQRAQRWSFGPQGIEYFLRWDGAPTRNELCKALKSGASTVQLCCEQTEQSGSSSSSDGRPWVGRATLTKCEVGKREADDTEEKPQPKEKRSKPNGHDDVVLETTAAESQ